MTENERIFKPEHYKLPKSERIDALKRVIRILEDVDFIDDDEIQKVLGKAKVELLKELTTND